MARFSSVSSDEKNKNNDTDNYNFLRAHGKLVTMENLAKYLGDRITVMKNSTPKDISEILSKVNGYMEMHETKRKAEIDTNRTKERDKLNELKK
jgi:hypothetical protein